MRSASRSAPWSLTDGSRSRCGARAAAAGSAFSCSPRWALRNGSSSSGAAIPAPPAAIPGPRRPPERVRVACARTQGRRALVADAERCCLFARELRLRAGRIRRDPVLYRRDSRIHRGGAAVREVLLHDEEVLRLAAVLLGEGEEPAG